jgi:hypothetical protein
MQNPDNMRQLSEVASSLGLGGGGQGSGRLPSTGQETPQGRWNQNQNAGSFNAPPHGQQSSQNNDLSYIRSMLEQLVHNGQAPPPPQTPDFSGLSSLLSGNNGQQPPSAAGEGGLDLSALSGILSGLSGAGGSAPNLSGLSGLLGGLAGGNKQESSPTGLSALTSMLGGDKVGAASPFGGNTPGGMDFGMLLKFQQAMSSISAGAGNVKLLLGLKSHLKDPQRVSKVDDAIRVMQMIQFLPLLKESGLFGKLEEILDGVGLGSIGNMLGGLSGGR